jgi:diguanylate cyclase (GGDEF)-like protein/PAS domain S-box-containing protein
MQMVRNKENITKKIFEELSPIWQTIGQVLLIVKKSGVIFYANQDCLDGISMTIEELQSADVDEILPAWRQLAGEQETGLATSKVVLELKNNAKQRVVVFHNMQRINLENEEVFFFHQKREQAPIISEDDNKNIFKMALDHINDPFFIWKKIDYGEIILNFCNGAARQVLLNQDYCRAGMKLDEFSNHLLDIANLIKDSYETGQILRKEVQYKSDTPGYEKWFLSEFIPITDEYLININIDITTLKQNSGKYADQERQMRILLKNLPGLAYRCRNDENWTMEFVSDGSVDLLGFHPYELQGNQRVSYGELIHPDDRQEVREQIQAKLAEKTSFQIVYRVITSDQNVKHVWEKGQGIFSDQGEVLAIEGFITDITERVNFERNAEKAKVQAEALQEAMAELSSQLDLSQVLRRILLSLRKILAFDSATLFLKVDDQLKVVAARGFKNTSRLIDKTFPADNMLLNAIQKLEKPIILEDAQADPRFAGWEGANSVRGWLGVPLIRRGQFLGFLTIDSYSVGAYHDEDALIAQTFADEAAIMIENARLYEKAQQMATFDALTGIHNRRYFFEEASKEFKRNQRYGNHLSVIMIDIDHFKLINDRFGHAAGDKVLIQFVDRVKKQVRSSDILARYGGEEFSILLPETGLDQARQFAERIREEVAFQPFNTGEAETYITISLGVAEYTEDVTQLDELIGRSDKAMYEAKQFGRNRVRIWRNLAV